MCFHKNIWYKHSTKLGNVLEKSWVKCDETSLQFSFLFIGRALAQFAGEQSAFCTGPFPVLVRGRAEAPHAHFVQVLPVSKVVVQVVQQHGEVHKVVPRIVHVDDEVVDEGHLGLGDAAGVSVESGHHHR